VGYVEEKADGDQEKEGTKEQNTGKLMRITKRLDQTLAEKDAEKKRLQSSAE
jgi:hypothetical protein